MASIFDSFGRELPVSDEVTHALLSTLILGKVKPLKKEESDKPSETDRKLLDALEKLSEKLGKDLTKAVKENTDAVEEAQRAYEEANKLKETYRDRKKTRSPNDEYREGQKVVGEVVKQAEIMDKAMKNLASSISPNALDMPKLVGTSIKVLTNRLTNKLTTNLSGLIGSLEQKIGEVGKAKNAKIEVDNCQIMAENVILSAKKATFDDNLVVDFGKIDANIDKTSLLASLKEEICKKIGSKVPVECPDLNFTLKKVKLTIAEPEIPKISHETIAEAAHAEWEREMKEAGKEIVDDGQERWIRIEKELYDKFKPDPVINIASLTKALCDKLKEIPPLSCSNLIIPLKDVKISTSAMDVDYAPFKTAIRKKLKDEGIKIGSIRVECQKKGLNVEGYECITEQLNKISELVVKVESIKIICPDEKKSAKECIEDLKDFKITLGFDKTWTELENRILALRDLIIPNVLPDLLKSKPEDMDDCCENIIESLRNLPSEIAASNPVTNVVNAVKMLGTNLTAALVNLSIDIGRDLAKLSADITNQLKTVPTTPAALNQVAYQNYGARTASGGGLPISPIGNNKKAKLALSVRVMNFPKNLYGIRSKPLYVIDVSSVGKGKKGGPQVTQAQLNNLLAQQAKAKKDEDKAEEERRGRGFFDQSYGYLKNLFRPDNLAMRLNTALESDRPIKAAIQGSSIGYTISDAISRSMGGLGGFIKKQAGTKGKDDYRPYLSKVGSLIGGVGEAAGSLTGGLTNFFPKGPGEEVGYFQDLRQLAFETQGLGKAALTGDREKDLENYKAQLNYAKSLEITTEDILATGMHTSIVQKQQLANWRRGIQDNKVLNKVTTVGLQTAKAIGSNAEQTADYFADLNQYFALGEVGLSQMGRSMKDIARSSGVTGDKLLGVVKSSETIMKNMMASGTFSVTAAKNIAGIMAESSKTGTSEISTNLLNALSSGFNLFTGKVDQKMQSLIISATGGNTMLLDKLFEGTLLQDKGALRQFTTGLEAQFIKFAGVRPKDLDKLSSRQRGLADINLQAAFGVPINTLKIIIENMNKALMPFADQITQANEDIKKAREGVDPAKLNMALERKRTMIISQGMDYLTKFNDVLNKTDGPDAANMAMKKFAADLYANDGDIAKNLKALGSSFDTSGKFAGDIFIKTAEQINEKIKLAGLQDKYGQIKPEDIKKALEGGKKGQIQDLIKRMNELDAIASTEQKALTDPITRMDRTLLRMEVLLRDLLRQTLTSSAARIDQFIDRIENSVKTLAKGEFGAAFGKLFSGIDEAIGIPVFQFLTETVKTLITWIDHLVTAIKFTVDFFINVGKTINKVLEASGITSLLEKVAPGIGTVFNKIEDFTGLTKLDVAAGSAALAVTIMAARMVGLTGVIGKLGGLALGGITGRGIPGVGKVGTIGNRMLAGGIAIGGGIAGASMLAGDIEEGGIYQGLFGHKEGEIGTSGSDLGNMAKFGGIGGIFGPLGAAVGVAAGGLLNLAEQTNRYFAAKERELDLIRLANKAKETSAMKYALSAKELGKTGDMAELSFDVSYAQRQIAFAKGANKPKEAEFWQTRLDAATESLAIARKKEVEFKKTLSPEDFEYYQRKERATKWLLDRRESVRTGGTSAQQKFVSTALMGKQDNETIADFAARRAFGLEKDKIKEAGVTPQELLNNSLYTKIDNMLWRGDKDLEKTIIENRDKLNSKALKLLFDRYEKALPTDIQKLLPSANTEAFTNLQKVYQENVLKKNRGDKPSDISAQADNVEAMVLKSLKGVTGLDAVTDLTSLSKKIVISIIGSKEKITDNLINDITQKAISERINMAKTTKTPEDMANEAIKSVKRIEQFSNRAKAPGMGDYENIMAKGRLGSGRTRDEMMASLAKMPVTPGELAANPLAQAIMSQKTPADQKSLYDSLTKELNDRISYEKMTYVEYEKMLRQLIILKEALVGPGAKPVAMAPVKPIATPVVPEKPEEVKKVDVRPVPRREDIEDLLKTRRAGNQPQKVEVTNIDNDTLENNSDEQLELLRDVKDLLTDIKIALATKKIAKATDSRRSEIFGDYFEPPGDWV